jgi:UPF0716 protein FxsA
VLVLVLLFIVMPLAELYVIIQVGQSVGVLWTILLLLTVSIVGAFLVKVEGLRVLFRVREGLMRGELPSEELLSGLAVLLAGALVLTPGFITDGVGLFLLLPPTRAIVVKLLKRRFAGRLDPMQGPPHIHDTTTTDE